MEKEAPFCEKEAKQSERKKREEGASISRSIADGIGEYRRQIEQIRARHGRQSRKTLLAGLDKQ